MSEENFVYTDEERQRLKRLYEWDPWEEDASLHLHFHPEEATIDPGELDIYSYFHPETIDAARLI